ncbi:MAG: Gfo/Idh/MocA family oxidoreductase [Caldilineaceae bacterium]|nr:Gfo/Idh/MocA family oxidoreductase [Caldilineaceae bacterium]
MGIHLGLVGLGSFGSSFADLFMSHPLVDRIALCDREPERMAAIASRPSWQKKLQPSDLYASLDEICHSDLDALVIITQPWLHAAQCVQAMEAGKHVYSAVPITNIPDDNEILDWCDRLVETVKRTGKHYMLGETTYYRPQTIFCRRKAAEGAFGDFVYSEGEYFHDVDAKTNLREVMRRRTSSASGQEWIALRERYKAAGALNGPMHYPTHSTSGPISVMGAHALKVCCWGYVNQTDDGYFIEDGAAFSNETALFYMSNGATMRICEHREIGHTEREIFRVYGTQASFENDTWVDKLSETPVSLAEMRDPLPDEVIEAFREVNQTSDFMADMAARTPIWPMNSSKRSPRIAFQPSTSGKPCAIWPPASLRTSLHCAMANCSPSQTGAMRPLLEQSPSVRKTITHHGRKSWSPQFVKRQATQPRFRRAPGMETKNSNWSSPQAGKSPCSAQTMPPSFLPRRSKLRSITPSARRASASWRADARARPSLSMTSADRRQQPS